MISLKVLYLAACVGALDTNYFHSVVVQGHVKDSAAPVTSPPSLSIADSPSRRSRDYYDYGGDYYTGAAATYHPVVSHEAPPPAQGRAAVISHHGGLVTGHHGFAGHHGGHLLGPLGYASHHGGLIKTPWGLAGHHSKLLHGHLGGGGLYTHGGFHLRREAEAASPIPSETHHRLSGEFPTSGAAPPTPGGHFPRGLGFPQQQSRNAPSPPNPVPVMPGLVRGGAALALYDSHALDRDKQLHGVGQHGYKHFSLDRGYGGPCASRPFHVVHADHGYDTNVLDVGGAGHKGADSVYGLGGSLGLL